MGYVLSVDVNKSDQTPRTTGLYNPAKQGPTGTYQQGGVDVKDAMPISQTQAANTALRTTGLYNPAKQGPTGTYQQGGGSVKDTSYSNKTQTAAATPSPSASPVTSGYNPSVDVNKPYEDRAAGISDSYESARQGVTDVYNTTKQSQTDLYNQQKSSTGSAYDALLAGKTQAQNLSYQAAQEPYNYNLSQAGSLYQPARNEAYTQNAAAQFALRERMANIGASGSGGMSQKQQQKLGTSFQQGLTGIDLAQQQYVDEQNRGLSTLSMQNDATMAGMTSENEYNKTQAIADLEAKMAQAGIDLDSQLGQQLSDLAQQESSALSQNELERLRAEQAQRTSDINMYLNMYLNGRISKKQFKQMTGLEI